MMRIIFTKNSLPLSKLICWATGEQVSHVAIVFDEKYVFHSNIRGVHITSWTHFKKLNEVLADKSYSVGLILEEEAFQKISLLEEKWYDVGSLLFWAVALFRKKFFGLDIPKRNLWASSDFFTCVEVLRDLPRWVWPDDISDEIRNGEITPGEAANYLGATWL